MSIERLYVTYVTDRDAFCTYGEPRGSKYFIALFSDFLYRLWVVVGKAV